MYTLRSDATKILNQYLKLEHDKNILAKPREEQARLWDRFHHMLSQIEADHVLYPKFVFDGFDLKRYANLKRENLSLEKNKNTLPVIGKGIIKQRKDICMNRERGFNYDNNEYPTLHSDTMSQSSQIIAEGEILSSSNAFGSKDVPRFQHPDKAKLMASVRNDI